MIRIAKGPKPPILEANEHAWTQEFLEALAAGGAVPDAIRFRYRHADIKAALVSEAFGKCIYCEQKISPGETDHIFPVSAKPGLLVVWENLGLACKDCNTYKGHYYSEAEPLLNPFLDDPKVHLLFFGPLVMSQVGDQLGFRTVERVRLHRMQLVERRKERIERMQALLEQWNALPEGATKALTKEKILQEASADQEYAAVIRAYLYQALGWPVEQEQVQHAA